MPDWLLDRSTVIGLAILGGICSLLASWCQSRESIPTQYASWFSKAAYVFMATSIILFVGAGMFATET
jgi:predicted membrane channel-forming protein YqfA (hemolysin III family)